MYWREELERLLEQMVAEGRLHLVDVERLLGPGDPTVAARFVAVCTCGWRSTDEDARRLAEDAGLVHVCKVPQA